jgi:hypothetical protein
MEDDFDDAVLRFKAFLENNGFPSCITWLTDADILLTGSKVIYMRHPDEKSTEKEARKAFKQGLARGNGVLIKRLFSKDDKTYSFVWCPENQTEAEYALLPREIKFSVITSQVFKMVVVQDEEEWLHLADQYSPEQSQRMQLFE